MALTCAGLPGEAIGAVDVAVPFTVSRTLRSAGRRPAGLIEAMYVVANDPLRDAGLKVMEGRVLPPVGKGSQIPTNTRAMTTPIATIVMATTQTTLLRFFGRDGSVIR